MRFARAVVNGIQFKTIKISRTRTSFRFPFHGPRVDETKRVFLEVDFSLRVTAPNRLLGGLSLCLVSNLKTAPILRFAIELLISREL